MCCLFGLIDFKHHFSGKQKAKLIHALAAASEARGTDATGLAYNSGGKLHVYKRPVAGHKLRFHIPEDAAVVMGHTRMTTQGNEKRNCNNHPFRSRVGRQEFALAHNGVLYNDLELRKAKKLPRTNIETDSFVAVQLLEQQGQVSFDSLRYMAEQLEGTFSFTVLDGANNLYFIKGDNPLCIYHYPAAGIYLYASTEDILLAALLEIPYKLGQAAVIKLTCGELLRIDSQGGQQRGEFDAGNLFIRRYYPCSIWLDPEPMSCKSPSLSTQAEYIQELKTIAGYYGFSPGYIDSLLADGFTTDDVEEMIYCGGL